MEQKSFQLYRDGKVKGQKKAKVLGKRIDLMKRSNPRRKLPRLLIVV